MREVSARFGILLVLWGLTWVLASVWLPESHGPGVGWLFWFLAKVLVWIVGGALLFGGTTWRAWSGAYRGRAVHVGALALVLVGLDVPALRSGLKPTPASPTLGWPLVTVLVVAPLFEEALFRGVIWSRLERFEVRRWQIWLGTAAAFALLHLPGWLSMQGPSPALAGQAFLVFATGLVCGAGRWLTGSTFAAVALHLVNNAQSIGLLFR